MSDITLRIKVAKALGYVWMKWGKRDDPPDVMHFLVIPRGNNGNFTPIEGDPPPQCITSQALHDVPNFEENLDACAAFEATLSVNEWTPYLDILYRIVQDPHICQTSHAFLYVTASARQRCEAFLRTKGLW